MSFNIEITFGGLCLFVQRDDAVKKGLFVLMPAFVDHVPLLCYGGECTDSPQIVPIHQIVSLSGLTTPGKRSSFPSFIATVSEIMSDKRVANHWTEDEVLVNPLVARVDLDLGLQVQDDTSSKKADVHAFYEKKGDVRPRIHKHPNIGGKAIVWITNVPDSRAPIIVGGKSFDVPKNDQGVPTGAPIQFSLLNIDPNDLHPSKGASYPEGTSMPHFGAYYNLLVGCSAGCVGPTLYLDTPVTIAPCTTKYVDPVTCMLGGGCSEQEAC